jgi:hypothetical protein
MGEPVAVFIYQDMDDTENKRTFSNIHGKDLITL